MRRFVIATPILLLLGLLTQPLRGHAQVAPADPGQRLPEAALRQRAVDPDAYRFGRALHEVTRRAAAVRAELGTMLPGAAMRAPGAAVTGQFQVPVFAVSFSDTPSDPWPIADLQERLFGASDSTLTAFYDEISLGKVDVTGSVYGWTPMSGDNGYYAGASNGLDTNDAHLGELIRDTIDLHDAGIDFGQFDNDGPDGVPNSGDDDGYVDFVAFVHPEVGGECGGGNPNIWSHRWRYSSWPSAAGVPYVTDDASANGGSILVDDYVIQPGLACGGQEMIQIGVFCHEFGHAFDLPDLYDVNGGGAAGLGHWCLMAAGNWNDPDRPAHMSAWTKRELGWVETIDVDWQGATLELDPVETSGRIHRLGFRDDRWRRRGDCTLSGDASLAVGLDSSASGLRGWVAPKGYGNGWTETVVRDFHYDGIGAVTLEYDYRVDSEGGFDFCFVLVEVDGEESTLAVYDGSDWGHATHDLTGFFSGPGDYRVKFRFRSDTAWSNEDGNFVCDCSPFVIDELSVDGGGESHFADFEQHVGGWYQPDDPRDNPVSEFWLVENRQAVGFDENVHGTGLMIYHVDQEIIDSSLGNSGGSDDLAARGVVVEEGDGLRELVAKTDGNRGDAGDTWPGATGSTVFDTATSPGALSNDGDLTPVAVRDIQVVGDLVRATFVAGEPAPVLTGTVPSEAFTDVGSITLEIAGAENLRPGVVVRLLRSGRAPVVATDVEWTDQDRVRATFEPSLSDWGAHDVVVENPDGQTAVVAEGFTFVPVSTEVPRAPTAPDRLHLAQNHPNPFNPRTTLRFEVPRPMPLEIAVFDARGRLVDVLFQGTAEAGHHEVRWDGTDARGAEVSSGLYFARMRGDDVQQTRKMMLAR